MRANRPTVNLNGKKLTTRGLQHSEYHRSYSSRCSEGSDGDLDHDPGSKFHDSGSEGEGAISPSLYRLEKMKKGDEQSADMARDGAQSEFGSDDEEAVEQSDNEQTESDSDLGCSVLAQSNDEMIAQLL